MDLNNIVELYKKEHNIENYHNLLKAFFTDINQILILPSKMRDDNNGFDLKSIYDISGKSYLVAYVSSEFIKVEDETFIKISIKGILEKILKSENCSGLIINPDLNINQVNMYKQCILPREDIIKILSN